MTDVTIILWIEKVNKTYGEYWQACFLTNTCMHLLLIVVKYLQCKRRSLDEPSNITHTTTATSSSHNLLTVWKRKGVLHTIFLSLLFLFSGNAHCDISLCRFVVFRHKLIKYVVYFPQFHPLILLRGSSFYDENIQLLKHYKNIGYLKRFRILVIVS